MEEGIISLDMDSMDLMEIRNQLCFMRDEIRNLCQENKLLRTVITEKIDELIKAVGSRDIMNLGVDIPDDRLLVDIDYAAFCGELSLSTRAYNGLRRAGVRTLRDLSYLDINELGNIRNLGRSTVAEIIEFAKNNGIMMGTQSSTEDFFEEKLEMFNENEEVWLTMGIDDIRKGSVLRIIRVLPRIKRGPVVRQAIPNYVCTYGDREILVSASQIMRKNSLFMD